MLLQKFDSTSFRHSVWYVLCNCIYEIPYIDCLYISSNWRGNLL